MQQLAPSQLIFISPVLLAIFLVYLVLPALFLLVLLSVFQLLLLNVFFAPLQPLVLVLFSLPRSMLAFAFPLPLL